MAKNPLKALLDDKEKSLKSATEGKGETEGLGADAAPSVLKETPSTKPVSNETAAMVERSMDSMRDPDAFILPTSAISIPGTLLRELNQAHAEETGESMRVNGQDTPIIVEQLPGGSWELVAGLHRLNGKKIMAERYPMELEHRQIRAVRKGSSSALKTAYRENADRLNFTPTEEAAALALLLQESGVTQKQLAQDIGKTESHISKYLALNDAAQDIKAAIDSGALSMSYWYANRAVPLKGLLGNSSQPEQEEEEEEEKTAAAPKKKKPAEQRIAVPLSVAKKLAALLAELAAQHDLPPVEIKSRATKADYQAIINVRGEEIADAVVGGGSDSDGDQ